MYWRLKIVMIVAFTLIGLGLAIYLIYANLLWLFLFTLGFGALTFAWGITNTMVRVEKYFDNEEIHMKFPKHNFKCEYCGKSFGEEPMKVGIHLVKEHPEKIGEGKN